MSKKGFQLSINFIVILIISLAVLAGAFVLSGKLFGAVVDTQKDLDKATQDKILNLLKQGDLLAVGYQRMEVIRGDSINYGLGILNVDNTKPHFLVDILFDEAFDSSQNPTCTNAYDPGCPWHSGDAQESWEIYWDQEPFELGKNEEALKSLYFKPGKSTKTGTFIFLVNVTSAATESDVLAGTADEYTGRPVKIQIVNK